MGLQSLRRLPKPGTVFILHVLHTEPTPSAARKYISGATRDMQSNWSRSTNATSSHCCWLRTLSSSLTDPLSAQSKTMVKIVCNYGAPQRKPCEGCYSSTLAPSICNESLHKILIILLVFIHSQQCGPAACTRMPRNYALTLVDMRKPLTNISYNCGPLASFGVSENQNFVPSGSDACAMFYHV